MEKNKVKSPDTSSLKDKAEEQLKERQSKREASMTGHIEQYENEADLMKLNHELAKHKIELELQNKELREALYNAETAIALYDFSPVGCFTVDYEGIITQLNLSAAKMLGWDRSVFENINIRPFVSQDTLPQFNEFLIKAFDTHSRQNCEVILIGHKNSYTVHLQGIAPIQEDKCHLTALDISERKIVETQIQEQKQFFEQVFSESSVSTQILDKDGWCEKINPKLSELFGVKPEDIEGKKYNILQDKALRQEGIIPILETVFKEGKAAEWDVFFDIGMAAESQHIPVADKTKKRWFHNWAYPIFDQDGLLTHVIIQHTDITHRKTLDKAIEQGPSSIVITDAGGKIGFVNQKFTEMTQYQLDEVKGKSPRIFNPGRLPQNDFVELWEALKKGKTWEGEVLNRKKDQSLFWEEVSISSVKNPDGTLSNYILIQNDITEKKQTLLDLIQAKEEAIQSDRLKSAFLANMSHEIRTPLNSIIGFSELMSEPDFDPAQQFQFSRIIFNSGNKLLSIISDIMDLSKIDAGEVKIEPRPISVSQVMIDIGKEYSFKAVAKELEWKLELPDGKDLVIESDENKIRQILINFVENALKFTEKGFIEIGARANGAFVQFHVKDTGIGIPAEFQAQIFIRFRQVEPADTRKYGGNGLGLTISKALVELLGGKVWLESREGIGSTFYFTLPIKKY